MTEQIVTSPQASGETAASAQRTTSPVQSDPPGSMASTAISSMTAEEMRVSIQKAVEEQKRAQLAAYYEQLAKGHPIAVTPELENLLKEPIRRKRAATTKLPSAVFTGRSFQEYKSFSH
ncbi:hypothetical protein LEL_10361 [Akanthomyces lecanii RCEF 1005]|uniref:Uncharacterized protein n=1 Tax=Akanthomyces lecanii RCEF 1005 TaxID=1081108 RepID=A0A167ZNT1_CORDF|nr:hypothetical protein LEL_10361 [Akanthomyces lecanii RCEF 1005]